MHSSSRVRIKSSSAASPSFNVSATCSAGTGALREMIARLKAGFWVGIFPEGTRSPDGKLGEIKPGFLAMLRRANVPVCPVGIAGADRALGRNHKLPHFSTVQIGRAHV